MVYPIDPYNHRSVHDAAAARLHQWHEDFMQKSQQPDTVKVGPEGYVHGWVKVFSAGSVGMHSAAGSLHLNGKHEAAKHMDAAAKLASKAKHGRMSESDHEKMIGHLAAAMDTTTPSEARNYVEPHLHEANMEADIYHSQSRQARS
jgi:hypothetical protein